MNLKSVVLGCFCWLVVLVGGRLALAQPAPAVPPDPPGRRVFVPLEELQTLIQRDRNWVLLPREEFNRLFAEAKKNTLDKPQPPQAVGVGNVKYAARVDEDQLIIVATAQITKFTPGWQMLPLDFPGLSIEKATLGDQAARLGRDPQAGGRLVLLLDKAGQQTLTLELSRPLVAVGSDKLAAFGLAPLWPGEFTLDVPPEKHLQWNGVAVERPVANDQVAQFKMPFGGQKQIELRITDRQATNATEGLVFAHTAMGVQAAPEEVTWRAVTSLQVFGKPLDQLQFRVPEALQIISITSPGLESWEFGPNGPENGETILNLKYRQAFQEPRDITFQAVLATKTGEGWQVPNLKLANVASHVTQLLVNTDPRMRLQLEESVGVQRTVTEEEAKNPAVNADLRFSAWREDFVLRFTTQPKAREISAAVVTLLDINQNGLDLQTRATVETRFAPLFDVSLTLPAEWTVTDVLVNGKRMAWESVPQEAGLHLLRVTLEKPLPENEKTVLQLSAHVDPKEWPLEEGTATIALPEVRVLQTNAVEGNFVVAAERDLDVQPQELKGLTPTLLDPALSARLSYEYQDTHYSGNVIVLRKPSRISVKTFAEHRLDKETFFSHLEARLNIEGGGTRRIQVSLPETAGLNLRFGLSNSVARIVEQTAADPANGRRVWTLLLDQRAYGDALIHVDVSQSRKESKEFSPPTLQVVGAERETGMIAFEAEPDQQLDVVATNAVGRALPDVDPTDLPIPTGYVARERIVAAFGYVLPGYQLKLTERRFARVAVPTAICDQLKLVSILGETGEMQHEATFLLRAVGVQSLQVTLPEKAHLWATLLDDAPIEVRQTKTAYLIPLMATKGGEGPLVDPGHQRTLKLYYRTEVSPLTTTGTLTQSPPGITVLNGDGTEQPLEILQQEWTIHHPDQTDFVADPGSFLTQEQPLGSSLLISLLRHFQVDSPMNLLWKLATLAGAAAMVWIARRILSVSSVRVRLTNVLIVLFVGAIVIALLLPATPRARSAARTSAFKHLSDSHTATSGVADADMSVWNTAGAPATSMPAPVAAPAAMPPGASDFAVGGEAKPADDMPVPQEEALQDVAKSNEGEVVREELKSSLETATKPAELDAGAKRDQSKELDAIAAIESKSEKQAESREDFSRPSRARTTMGREPKDAKEQPDERKRGGMAQPNNGQQAANQPMPGGAAPPPPAKQPAAPQPQVPQRPGKELSGELTEVIGGKAVLSLALNLEPPAHSRSTVYTYRGRLKQQRPELVIKYQNRAKLSFVMLAVQMIMIVICWLVRQRALAVRGLILALGIGLPLALTTVVSPDVLPFLDGVLLGTLFGVALWMIIALCRWFTPAKLWQRLNAPIGSAAIVLVALCLTQGATTAQAQQPAPNAPGAPPVHPTTTPIIDANTIVVPFGDTDPKDGNRVLLHYSKFVELWKQAHPDEPDLQASPIPAAIVEALYSAELVPAVDGKKANIKLTGRFVCYSYRDGQVTLPFPIGPIALSSAQLDGEAAPLVPGNAQQPLAALISKPGLHVVDLQFSIPVQLTGPAGVFNLDLGDVPTGTVRFKVPAPDLNFRVNGSSGAFRRIGQGAEAALLIPISQGGQFQVSWQPKQDKGDVAAIVHVDSVSALTLTEEGPRLLSHWIYQVRQGSISEAIFSLPAEVGVRKIEGQDVGGWEVAGEGDARQLKIFLRRKVEDNTQLKFDLFLKQKADDLETTYAVPNFAPQNITRETGILSVLVDKQFGARVGNISGLSQIEPQQVPLARLGAEFKTPVTLAYRFATRPYVLELVVNRRQPQLKVIAKHHAHIDPRKVQQHSRFTFNLTGAPRAGLSILIPQGYLLQNVLAPDVADWHVSGREDSADMDAEALLHLAFPAPRMGTCEIVLTGKTLRQPTDLKAEVSLPYPLEVDELDTQLLTTLDPIYTASATMLDNWKSIDPKPFRSLFIPVAEGDNELGFSSQTPAPAPIPFDLKQAQPRLTTQSLTLLNVGEDSLDYLFALQWNITSAGADTFVFTTPDWLGGKLDFPTGTGPRRRGITQEAIDNGRIRWTITLEDPQRERYFIVGRAVLPPSATGDITVPGFSFEQVIPGQDPPQILPLETQTPYIVLVNQSQTQLTPVAPDAVEAIPAEDLSRVIKIRQDLIDQAAEIVRVKTPGMPVAWKQQRFEAEAQLPAAVNLAHHITVLAPDGSWREQVIYRLRNRKRQFLAVKLPPESQVLSLFVQGRPARPVEPPKELGFTLIPLPKTVEGDLSFEVQLVLAGSLTSGPLPRKWGLVRRQIDLPIPAVVSPEENPEYGIPVSQTTWTVYAPADLDVDILKDSRLTNVTPVTATAQAIDQTTAMLNDVTQLIAVNTATDNRRVQAQSLNNLKQLGMAVNELKAANVARNSLELTKQKDLQQRAAQLEDSINRIIVSNSAEGLKLITDGTGNTVVVDEKAAQDGQTQRLEQLYSDNPNAPDHTPTPVTANPQPNDGKPAVSSGKKGNIDRDNLKGFNYSQVQELAIEQRQKVENDEAQQQVQAEVTSKPRSYNFNLPGNQAGVPQGGQAGFVPNEGQGQAAALGLQRRGDQLQPPHGGPAPADRFGNFMPPMGDRRGTPLIAQGRPGLPVAGPGPGNVGGGGGMGGGGMGGMGGMGGGMGGGDFDGEQGLAPVAWTSSGGLSLLIDIPADGTTYNFSKVSGGARLSLAVRPHQTWQLGLGLIWTATWLLIVAAILWAINRPAAKSRLLREAPWALLALGAVTFFLVRWDAGFSTASLIVFIVGAIWLAFRKPVKSAAIGV